MAQATWTTQEIGADQLLVKVKVDASGIEDELKKHLDETRRTAQIDGFRKGKAPDSVLMRRFGSELLKAAKAGLLESSVKVVASKILEQRDAKEPGEPRTEDVTFVRGTGLSFDMWLKVPPHPPKAGFGDGTVVDLRRS